ncbi:MAG TPA: hypothetical protein VGZ32_27805 [Actinocrinis sp.]|uniref:hypothetical protein n=1 Tax=Actinocrinis sp. TaxID=1920516 RepID=UPI002DDD52A7|nr:hypothetical protein [Actinocrinis sp.]HEV3174186.1 hypothetical protein [Actinocrinis sp.]
MITTPGLPALTGEPGRKGATVPYCPHRAPGEVEIEVPATARMYDARCDVPHRRAAGRRR